MAYIGKTPTIGNFQVCDAISVVNGQAAYTMQVGSVNVSPESANHMLVSLNGILQKAGSSFTVSGSTITFASNLVTGDVIDFIQILGNVLDLGVPSDSTVSLAKLTATGTKSSSTFLRGDNTFAEAGGGKILQVKTATDETERSTTTTSFVTASNTLTLNITPSSSSSKIYLIAHTNCFGSNSNTNIYYTIFRDSTNLGSSNDGMLALHKPQYTTSFNTASHNACIQILDEPSSSSQQTYQVYFAAASGTAHINYHSGKSVITAMEVSA